MTIVMCMKKDLFPEIGWLVISTILGRVFCFFLKRQLGEKKREIIGNAAFLRVDISVVPLFLD